jgi:hypothetical protein
MVQALSWQGIEAVNIGAIRRDGFECLGIGGPKRERHRAGIQIQQTKAVFRIRAGIGNDIQRVGPRSRQAVGAAVRAAVYRENNLVGRADELERSSGRIG